jgi:competence protein ComEA
MWKDYFYHTKSERLGLMLLLSLILLTTVGSWGIDFWQKQEVMDASAFSEEVAAFELDIASLEAAERASKKKYTYREQKSYKKRKDSKERKKEEAEPLAISYFDFDPNKASKEELMQLGLSSRTAQSILNYRSKGGEFRVKTDLAKIYTLSTEDYEALEGYILLPDSIARRRIASEPDPAQPKPKTIQIIDINQATADDFQQLRGIGPSFSKRIVKYRNALGGFINVDQIGEVYGLPDSTFLAIRSRLRCDAKIKKLNLNTATAEELKSHPYLRWKHANAIVRYRKENGPFTDPEILRTFFEFDDGYGTYWKIEPYLSL